MLEEGATEAAIHFEGTPRSEARLIIGAPEGAMLMARPYRDPERFQAAARGLLSSLGLAGGPRPKS